MNTVRVAVPSDASAIMDLVYTAPYSHLHVDWHLPGDWLGSPGFVVQEEEQSAVPQSTISSKIFGTRPRLRACLAATADPPPAAWVRVASITDAGAPEVSLAAMLQCVSVYLRQNGVTELAWLAVDDWADRWLPPLGFGRVNEIETYLKADTHLPAVTPVRDLAIRPVAADEMETLAAIEAAAFDPLWRHSAEALVLVRHQALSFDVALLEGQIVGFQFSTNSQPGAHLARITIRRDLQRAGIGSALLAHAIAGYHRQGLRQVSLNTQVDNLASQYLYRKFGFYATGQRLPVWVKPLVQEDTQ